MRGEDFHPIRAGAGHMETPPHAWGRLCDAVRAWVIRRNTPTCVGKTFRGNRREPPCRKHPHMRGEDHKRGFVRDDREETPPHAWGRQPVGRDGKPEMRNTPTCVGKTTMTADLTSFSAKHPHMRGEDWPGCAGPAIWWETPPHAWGRLPFPSSVFSNIGNTPTCVGKTDPLGHLSGHSWKHPHMRGEDSLGQGCNYVEEETPPHAWGRPEVRSEDILSFRNTPTCVGKTLNDH